MRVRIGVTLSLLAMVGLTGCGMIFNGTRQTVTANSAPDAASLTVAPGGEKYTTPASISLERKNNYVLTFTKAGYSTGTFAIQKHMNGGVLVLDILFTGLVGVVVDAATGAWYKLDPSTAQVVLTKTDVSINGPAEIKVELEKHGSSWQVRSSAPGVNVEVTKP